MTGNRKSKTMFKETDCETIYIESECILVIGNIMEPTEHTQNSDEQKRREELLRDMDQLKRAIMLSSTAFCELYKVITGQDIKDFDKDLHWDLFKSNKYDADIEEIAHKYASLLSPTVSPEYKILGGILTTFIVAYVRKNQEQQLAEKIRREEKWRWLNSGWRSAAIPFATGAVSSFVFVNILSLLL
jgi:hypothetical protein